MIQEIAIDALRPGMYLVGIDQPWYKTPFLLHRFLIKSQEEVLRLKQCGVKHVKIDLSRSQAIDHSLATDEPDVPAPVEAVSEDESAASDEPLFSPSASSSREPESSCAPLQEEPSTRYLSIS